MQNAPTNLLQAASLTEDGARQLLESLRWPDGPVCPHCGDKERCGELKGVKDKGGVERKGLYKCYACRKQFTVTVGTVMHRSHITLKQWVLAFYSICAHKKGVSAKQLERDLGLGSYKSSWHLCHRIREAMKHDPMKVMLGGKVEVDETYVGGKSPKSQGGRSVKHKTPVVAVIERAGQARATATGDAKGKTLKTCVREVVQSEATIYTDEWPAYKGIGKGFTGGHETVNHSRFEYARGAAHVNSCESFFALLKRGVHGTFHSVSKKHLGRYCHEFEFRWNQRKVTDGQRTAAAIASLGGRRLEYKTLIGKQHV